MIHFLSIELEIIKSYLKSIEIYLLSFWLFFTNNFNILRIKVNTSNDEILIDINIARNFQNNFQGNHLFLADRNTFSDILIRV